MIRIDRKEYLNFLIESKDKQIIKVVSGVRRCGKSTLFEIYKDYLIKNGVEKKQIISINFEDMDYEELTDYKKLYKYIKSKMIDNKKNYIFLDEIQHVDKFEKVVDSLFIKDNVDLYITGSNAYFMSSELATLLSGRYIELKMLPLSFKEYYQAKLEYEKLEEKENKVILMKISKKQVIRTILIILGILLVIILGLYVGDEKSRYWIEKNILGTSIEEEDLPKIEYEQDKNIKVIAYQDYVATILENQLKRLFLF